MPPYSITANDERKHIATMLVVPPPGGDYSLTVSNPHTYEMRSVFGGTSENAGSTLVAAWLVGTRQTMKVSYVHPVLAFVYTIFTKKYDGAVRDPPLIQRKMMNPVKRIRNFSDRKSTRLNSSHKDTSRMPSSA